MIMWDKRNIRKIKKSKLSHGPRWVFIIIIINIIICPLTVRVVGAPQMISQPVSSIFPCSPPPSGTRRTPGLSIPWSRLPTSSSVCLVLSPLSLYLAKWFGQTSWTGDMTIPLQLASLNDGQVFVWSDCLLDLGTDFLVGNMVFVWDQSKWTEAWDCHKNQVPGLSYNWWGFQAWDTSHDNTDNSSVFTSLKPLLNDRSIFLSCNMWLMRSLVTVIFLYASESWTLPAELQWRIRAIEKRCYRKIPRFSYKDYQRGSLCQDQAGNRTTRRPDHPKETQAEVVMTYHPFIWSGQNRSARHRKRWKKPRQTAKKR